MSRKGLLDLTIPELMMAYEGFQEQEKDRVIEARSMSRLVAYYSAQTYRLNSIKQIFLLPDEELTENSTEDLIRHNKEHSERFRIWQKKNKWPINKN